ncbi:hypothetical protein DPMN_152646 [Dreissena polymorpha]|uniref:Uncharacterized protein n=1 Tax=Dreissena polymorpha TaxID=45954 RepID=A0A9D4FHN2_DREPO|nr:hypothetical protein DPMN_152646 [Dreissena polymorpha]
MVTESNLNFLSNTTDAIFETLKALAESYDCKIAHPGKRSIRDPSALDSTDVCPVNFETTPKSTNGCHPVIPESIDWTTVLGTIIGIYLLRF